MREYPKIPGPFKRATEGPDKNKLIWDAWTSDEVEYLRNNNWIWTEKVDGTNCRIHWDGHRVSIGGRTANAQLHVDLIKVLENAVSEEVFEQVFEGTPVTLFGEGYGPGIQKVGVQYTDQKRFVLFDVLVGGPETEPYWLRRPDVVDVAGKLGVEVVPVKHIGSVYQAIQVVRYGLKSDWNRDLQVEGLVGTPAVPLHRRNGQRIILKVKSADFPNDNA